MTTIPAARIFLVGVPRSGTTLLQALLAAHPLVTSFTESHFFSRNFSTYPVLGTILRRNPAQGLAEFLAENGMDQPPTARALASSGSLSMRTPLTRPLLTLSTAKQLISVLDELGAARGATTWLEKTPRHVQRLALIETASDDGVPTHFVHIVRDGLQTVASLLKASRQWQRPYGLEECVQRWNSDMAITTKYLGKPAHHVVRYEALTENPERVLRPLVTALGLSRHDDLVARYREESSGLVTEKESWKSGVCRDIRPSATADDVLDNDQRRRALARLNQSLYDNLAAQTLEERDLG